MHKDEMQQGTGKSANWLNDEAYQRNYREVESWPDWKKIAYENLGGLSVRWDGTPAVR